MISGRRISEAALQQVLARVTGKSVELLSYDEVLQQLKLTGRSTRGVREIPVEAIVGTVGRFADFTRTFLPRKVSDEQRWANLMAFVQQNSLDALPPIDVYQIGSAYFVQDGHHRVSIARQLGIEFITAYVTEVQTRVPLTPDADWNALIRQRRIRRVPRIYPVSIGCAPSRFHRERAGAIRQVGRSHRSPSLLHRGGRRARTGF